MKLQILISNYTFTIAVFSLLQYVSQKKNLIPRILKLWTAYQPQNFCTVIQRLHQNILLTIRQTSQLFLLLKNKNI